MGPTYQMKDERDHENFEKKHPYKNFTKKISSVDIINNLFKITRLTV